MDPAMIVKVFKKRLLETEQEVKTIKVVRYANRKLYNTDTSKYTTLKELKGLIQEGKDIEVKANNGNDITNSILKKIVALDENSLNNNKLLKLIRLG